MSINNNSLYQFSTSFEHNSLTQNSGTQRLSFDLPPTFDFNRNLPISTAKVSISSMDESNSSSQPSPDSTTSTSLFSLPESTPSKAPVVDDKTPTGLQCQRDRIRKQLALILHSYKCKRDLDSSRRCKISVCARMKELYDHFKICTGDVECETEHCVTTRKIINHWNACKLLDCPVCMPFKQRQIYVNQNIVPKLNQSGKKRAAEDELFLQLPFLNNNPFKRSKTGNDDGFKNLPSFNPNSTLDDLSSQSTLSEDDRSSSSQMSPTHTRKMWHKEITQQHRNHTIHKIVQAMFPSNDPAAYRDKRVQPLIQYAVKFERGLYEEAPTKSIYYQSIAEIMYDVQSELALRKRCRSARLSQALSQDAVSDSQSSLQSCALATENRVDYDNQLQIENSKCDEIQQSQRLRDLVEICTKANACPEQPFPTTESQISTPQLTEEQSLTNGLSSCHSFKEEWQQYQQSSEYQEQLQRSLLFQQELQLSPQYQQDLPIISHRQQSQLQPQYQQSYEEHSQSVQLDPFKPQFSLTESKQDITATQELESQRINSQMPQFDPNLVVKTEVVEDVRQDSSNCDVPTWTSLSIPAVKVEEIVEHDATLQTESVDLKPVKVESLHPVPQNQRRMYKLDYLRQKLLPTLEAMYRQQESYPFQVPVDPVLLGIPTYFNIVKNPMDLSTIKRKLNSGEYRDPWQYIHDVYLMFDNAWLFNKKNTSVYRCCTKLSTVFESTIDPVMRSLGYCCGRKYEFSPQVICCYGKPLCSIQHDAKYWSYQHGSGNFCYHTVRYTYCEKCFAAIPGGSVAIGDELPETHMVIKKESFVLMKNNKKECEVFVNCVKCGRKFHEICVIHFAGSWPEGFVCDLCTKANGITKLDNKLAAGDLPATKMGTHIEIRVNKYLASVGVGKITVRVLSVTDKILEVKQRMKTKFVDKGEYPAQFPYRAKAIFAFQEIDGNDVCFFGMHVQEYGSDCPQPNTRRVYISYLDSVHFFNPRHCKTSVYHEILLGYLDFVKRLGFTMAHIWACPPFDGQDYIFNCHPPEQKVPKPKRLQDWYKKMLDRGIIERVVFEYKDILKQAEEDNLSKATDLPYFEGDFWQIVLEDSIKELERQDEQKMSDDVIVDVGENKAEVANLIGGYRKGKKKPKKFYKSKNNSKKNNKKPNSTGSSTLIEKIYNAMKKQRQVFLVVRLHSMQTAARLPEIQDPDPAISSGLMDGRDAFLALCRDKHYEFSSLRRSKYSTAALLQELQTQHRDNTFIYTCNNCRIQLDTRFNCPVCEDFDLCATCYEKIGHQHEMNKLDYDVEIESSNDNSEESTQTSLKHLAHVIEHSCVCRDQNCQLLKCQRIKRVIEHAKNCSHNLDKTCHICKLYFNICGEHLKHCQEVRCPVMFCTNIKLGNQRREVEIRLQQERSLMRRVAGMRSTESSSTPKMPMKRNYQHVDKKSAKIKNNDSDAVSQTPMNVDNCPPCDQSSKGVSAHVVSGVNNQSDAKVAVKLECVASNLPMHVKEEVVGTEKDESEPEVVLRAKQELCRLTGLLKQPKSVHVMREIFSILNANPMLKKSYLQQRDIFRKLVLERRIKQLKSQMTPEWQKCLQEMSSDGEDEPK